MGGWLKRHRESILVGLVVAVVAVTVPAIGHGVSHSRFAHNSGKLQGRDIRALLAIAEKADLSSTVAASPTSVVAGNGSTITLRLINPGLSSVGKAGISVQPFWNNPNTAVSWLDVGPTCSVDGNQVLSCPIPFLRGGTTESATATLVIDCQLPDTITLDSNLTSPKYDPNAGNNQDQTEVTCSP
jgi:hypothetical protein